VNSGAEEASRHGGQIGNERDVDGKTPEVLRQHKLTASRTWFEKETSLAIS